MRRDAHERSPDLYDFARVTDFTLTHPATISGINLTSAALPAVAREKLLRQHRIG